ncbi:hypothetical protein TGVAND_437280 [Toxoplasma gondii VAND]|uniref:Uncharacterized protein n=1 Tax=Toxoplasma gondii VAND TaxID=933077 RepID=A0A086PWY2_TOXGO|nr:hypothetical protein TGVAND_437280 [Toxoplasma gondii VAND]
MEARHLGPVGMEVRQRGLTTAEALPQNLLSRSNQSQIRVPM